MARYCIQIINQHFGDVLDKFVYLFAVKWFGKFQGTNISKYCWNRYLCIIYIHRLHVANKCNWKSGSVYQLNCNYQVYIILLRENTQTSHHFWKTISNSCSTKSADDSRERNNTTGNFLFLVRTPIKESDGTALLTEKYPVQVQYKCVVFTYTHTSNNYAFNTENTTQKISILTGAFLELSEIEWTKNGP